MAAHNQWLSTTRYISYWTTSVFPSTVTDLVLIYESVTSLASAVRWLTQHSWILNFWIPLRLNLLNSLMNYLLQLRKERIGVNTPNSSCFGPLSIAAGTSEPLPSKWTSDYVVIPAFRRCLPSRCLVTVIFVTIRCMGVEGIHLAQDRFTEMNFRIPRFVEIWTPGCLIRWRHRPDSRGIGVLFPVPIRKVSLLHSAQIHSGVHQVFHSMAIRGISPRGKAAEACSWPVISI
jgi:hypothetical protein